MITNTSNSYVLNLLPVNAGRIHAPNLPIKPAVRVEYIFSQYKFSAVFIENTNNFILKDITVLLNKGIPLTLCTEHLLDIPSLISPRCKNKVFV